MMHGAYVKFTNSNKKLIRVPTKIPPMAVDVSSEKEREKYRLTVRLKKKNPPTIIVATICGLVS